MISAGQKEWIEKAIARGVEEGAKLVLDGRGVKVPGYEGGYYVGPTIFDHVKPGIFVGDEEIFGPVTSIKRVKDFEEGLAIMNANRFANGSCIYTTSGRYAREFARRTDGGMVGDQRRHSGAVLDLPVLRAQAVVLRRPAHHRQGRRRLLHRDQVGHLGLVHRGGRQEDGQHLGRHAHPRLTVPRLKSGRPAPSRRASGRLYWLERGVLTSGRARAFPPGGGCGWPRLRAPQAPSQISLRPTRKVSVRIAP